MASLGIPMPLGLFFLKQRFRLMSFVVFATTRGNCLVPAWSLLGRCTTTTPGWIAVIQSTAITSMLMAALHLQYEHQRRETERLHMRQQKAVVMKVIDKLPKPVKTDLSDNTITLTIDRNRKLRGSVRPSPVRHSALTSAAQINKPAGVAMCDNGVP